MVSSSPTQGPQSLPINHQAPFVLLEDRRPGGRGSRLFRNPVAIVQCHEIREVESCIEIVESHLAQGRHAAGYLAYELNGAFESRSRRADIGRPSPLFQLGIFETETQVTAGEIDAFFAAMAPARPVRRLHPVLDLSTYCEKFERLLDYIRAGDVYQVNLTFPFEFDYDGDPLALYATLRARQAVAHGALVCLDDSTVLSVSPELHLDIANGVATTRPMKGTIARGHTLQDDQHNQETLRSDAKQRAENLMIVDLMRNDLSRISQSGSVRVTSPFEVETYPTFHAMTSTVSGRLLPGWRLKNLLAALFPCGSITGAPKVRAMEIIRELEHQPRGVYTGSIGAFGPDGRVDLNVAIRTAVLTPDGKGRYGVGSGVVADSNAEAEYRECLLKARVLAELDTDFGLIETLRLSTSGQFIQLEAHLDRLAGSAQRLDFPFDRASVLQRLDHLQIACRQISVDQRVRLELQRDGGLLVSHTDLAPLASLSLRVRLHDQPVDRADPFLRHKTTRRAFWDQALSQAQSQGADEALCVNHQGHLTEATRFNLFVRRGGRWLTPPLSDGLLPGILRAKLLQSGTAEEASLTLEDLQSAKDICLGNSLRGLIPCQVTTG